MAKEKASNYELATYGGVEWLDKASSPRYFEDEYEWTVMYESDHVLLEGWTKAGFKRGVSTVSVRICKDDIQMLRLYDCKN